LNLNKSLGVAHGFLRARIFLQFMILLVLIGIFQTLNAANLIFTFLTQAQGLCPQVSQTSFTQIQGNCPHSLQGLVGIFSQTQGLSPHL
jgi:hypothetical protein